MALYQYNRQGFFIRVVRVNWTCFCLLAYSLTYCNIMMYLKTQLLLKPRNYDYQFRWSASKTATAATAISAGRRWLLQRGLLLIFNLVYSFETSIISVQTKIVIIAHALYYVIQDIYNFTSNPNVKNCSYFINKHNLTTFYEIKIFIMSIRLQ